MTQSEKALQLHRDWNGKINTTPKCQVKSREDLAIAYTPGVAEPCKVIAENKEEAYNYCSLPEYDSKLDFIVIQMVIERYNRMGSEGTTSQNASGVSATYSDFYSDKVVKMLQKHRKVKMV